VQIAELPLDGRGRSVGHAGDPSAVEIENGERLENIVQLTRGELDGDILLIADLANMLEVPTPFLYSTTRFTGRLVLSWAHSVAETIRRASR
jgi:hypothetical protein